MSQTDGATQRERHREREGEKLRWRNNHSKEMKGLEQEENTVRQGE